MTFLSSSVPEATSELDTLGNWLEMSFESDKIKAALYHWSWSSFGAFSLVVNSSLSVKHWQQHLVIDDELTNDERSRPCGDRAVGKRTKDTHHSSRAFFLISVLHVSHPSREIFPMRP